MVPSVEYGAVRTGWVRREDGGAGGGVGRAGGPAWAAS
jgi:hypothetical protein